MALRQHGVGVTVGCDGTRWICEGKGRLYNNIHKKLFCIRNVYEIAVNFAGAIPFLYYFMPALTKWSEFVPFISSSLIIPITLSLSLFFSWHNKVQ